MPPALEPGAGRQGVVGKTGLGQSGMAIGLAEEQSDGTGTACTRPLVREGRHISANITMLNGQTQGRIGRWLVAAGREERRLAKVGLNEWKSGHLGWTKGGQSPWAEESRTAEPEEMAIPGTKTKDHSPFWEETSSSQLGQGFGAFGRL